MALTTTLTSRIDANLVVDLDIQTTTSLLAYSKVAQLATGTADNQADQVYTAQSTLAGTTGEVIDLSAPLTNPAGQSIKFTKIKALMLYADEDNASTIEIGPDATNGFLGFWNTSADRNLVPASGVLMLTSPVGGATVTENSTDEIYVYNNDTASPGNATYDIVIIGVATVV